MTDRRTDSILRLPDVMRRTRLSRPTIYRKIAAGTFPRQVSLSVNCVGWYETDVSAWISDPAGWTIAA